MTTTDININGTRYIAEVTLDDDGKSTISLTEACNHPRNDSCDHKTYDFEEVI
jgi:hypothetical protein